MLLIVLLVFYGIALFLLFMDQTSISQLTQRVMEAEDEIDELVERVEKLEEIVRRLESGNAVSLKFTLGTPVNK